MVKLNKNFEDQISPMNYLFTETTISNPVETVLILGKYILTHHHSKLRVFNFKMELVRERFFFEKILTIKKINDEYFFIVFDENKMTQCDIEFNPLCLRIIDGNDCDVYNGICIIKNPIQPQIFNVKDTSIRELRFANINIKNVTNMLLMQNFVPTLLVCTDDNICHVISLDVDPSKVDEFAILDSLILFKITKKFIIFANRNFIQIRYKRDVVIIKLNDNLSGDLLNESLQKNLIQPVYDDSAESRSIFLENPQVFCKEDNIFIINHNGELFRIDLKLDNKKIFEIKLIYEGKIEMPSCIDFTDEFLCVGSIAGDTILYTLNNSVENHSVQLKSPAECHNNDQLKSLTEISRLENIGAINDFSISPYQEMILLTTKGVYKAFTTIDILIFKKTRVEFKISKSIVADNQIILSADNKTFSVDENLKITEIKHDSDIDSYANGEYRIFLNQDAVLDVYMKDRLIVSFPGVTIWGLKNGKLALLRNSRFQFIDLTTLKNEFLTSNLLKFENDIYNEEIVIRDSIEDMNPNITSQIFEKIENQCIEESIIEMLIFHNKEYYIIFRTTKQLYIYKYTNRKMSKVFITKPLLFGVESKALFDLEDYVYCRSKHPCFIVFSDNVFFYDSNIKLGYPIVHNGWIFAVSKGQLLKCKTNINEDMIFTERIILKKQKEFDYEESSVLVSPINHKEQSSIMNQDEQAHLFEEYRNNPEYRHILSLYDCNILSVAKNVPFTYVPFIPMVHTTDGPDGKPRSEPINKEEAERIDKNPCLHGRTLRYFIELRSIDFKLISTISMEENEFICDMKIMFKNFLVICTSFPEGENTLAKGKLTVYSLVNIVPDPMNPHITKKLKLICSETFKNACLWCEEIRSLIAVCIGTRLMIYEFNENTGLDVVGRNEISMLSTSLFVTKNLIAVSDILNGIYFFFLRPRDPLKMHMLGRSCSIEDCRYLCGFDFWSSSDEKYYLSLVSLNKSGMINIFTYSPDYPGSKNGEALIKRAEISTKLRNKLYNTKLHRISDFEVGVCSLNTLCRIKAINVSNVQVIQNCIAFFINDRAGINVRNYLETEAFVNPECKSVVSECVILQFFYFNPYIQGKICELTGLTYAKISSIIEECLYNSERK